VTVRRRGAPDSVRNATRVALLALLVLSSAGCGKVAGSGSNRLRVDAPRWWFSLLPVRVTATPSGALAGRNATLTLAVNLNVVGERNTDGKAIAIWLPGSAFSTGANEVVVKTGTERSTVSVQVISAIWLVLPLAISVAIVLALFARLRERRRARAT